MSLPGERSPNDTLLSGAKCGETNQTVTYIFFPHQAPAVVAMILSDAKAKRICRVCADKIIDDISYEVGEKF